MTETVFYMRGVPPPGFEPGISEGLIRDAKLLLHLEQDQFDAIRAELESFRGFLDRDALEGLLQQQIDDAGICRRIARLIVAVEERSRIFKDYRESLVSGIGEWLQEEENRERNVLSDEEFQEPRLSERVKKCQG